MAGFAAVDLDSVLDEFEKVCQGQDEMDQAKKVKEEEILVEVDKKKDNKVVHDEKDDKGMEMPNTKVLEEEERDLEQVPQEEHDEQVSSLACRLSSINGATQEEASNCDQAVSVPVEEANQEQDVDSRSQSPPFVAVYDSPAPIDNAKSVGESLQQQAPPADDDADGGGMPNAAVAQDLLLHSPSEFSGARPKTSPVIPNQPPPPNQGESLLIESGGPDSTTTNLPPPPSYTEAIAQNEAEGNDTCQGPELDVSEDLLGLGEQLNEAVERDQPQEEPRGTSMRELGIL